MILKSSPGNLPGGHPFTAGSYGTAWRVPCEYGSSLAYTERLS